jgi:hypothetical protein
MREQWFIGSVAWPPSKEQANYAKINTNRVNVIAAVAPVMASAARLEM